MSIQQIWYFQENTLGLELGNKEEGNYLTIEMKRTTSTDRGDLPLAPDFELTDTRGNPIRLSAYRGRKTIVLVLNRGFA